MLEKLGLPEKCLQKLDIPLNNFFPKTIISKYHIKNLNIYASINPTLFPAYNLTCSEYYDKIDFIHIALSELDDYTDLYLLARNIYKICKCPAIIIFELDGMYKLEISLIAPEELNQRDYIIKHMLLSQWIFDDQESVETNKFFKEFASQIEKASDIQSLYKSYFKAISLINEELIPTKRGKELIWKILSKNIDEQKFFGKILENTRIFKICKQDGKINEFYAPECIWHSMNQIEKVKQSLDKEKVHDLDAFLRCDDGKYLVGAQEYIEYWGPDDQDDWDGENYSSFVDKYHNLLPSDNSENAEADILNESEEWNHLESKDKNSDDEEFDE